ncbi:MAG: YggT family protein [Candidatus Tectomicrobia bacterium]|uniref:YggT family protein n=1 Tax=Tectimicrobiota bacterium TaxID=2528274 RepID=A0A932CPR2_UNCTE|nr:YggT family protein [Candidatus Tectomicrobia bacterium]
MFVLGHFLGAIAKVLEIVLDLYMWVIIFRSIISWVNPAPYNPIVQFLIRITEPVLARLRRLLPISGMGIDFSPMIAILAIYFLKYFLVVALYDFALRLR